MNGVIEGLAATYIPTMTDEQLRITISYVLGELHYWLDGTPPNVSGEQHTTSKEENTVDA